MPRTREFDETEALDKALALFWRKGYEATSMRDLMAETGVATAGLYTAFGGKDGLFEAALQKYAQEILGANFARLETKEAGRADIEALFAGAVREYRGGVMRNGCFIANSGVEFSGRPGAVNRAVKRAFRREVRAFENALENAKARREVRKDLDIPRTANAMATTFFGLSAITRAGAPHKAVADAAAAAVALMD